MIDLPTARVVFINYLKVKLEFEDWHAIRDIAAELEVLDAKMSIVNSPPS
jgi:hypothetical protein